VTFEAERGRAQVEAVRTVRCLLGHLDLGAEHGRVIGVLLYLDALCVLVQGLLLVADLRFLLFVVEATC
jgi:hypothetical protein